jgi:Starch-binding associating with outer membrane
MKHLKYIMVMIVAVLLHSCELPDNINPKTAEEVPAVALFTAAEARLIEQVNSLDQNQNISRLLAQYNAQTTYFYDRSLPDEMWETLYRDVLLDLKEVRRLTDLDLALTAGVKTNRKAQIDILEVYTYHILVDLNGDVPYTEALAGRENLTPKYDAAATIYSDLINRLTASEAALDESLAGIGSADILYNDDLGLWKLFANSLQLRLAMRLADVNPALSKSKAEQAVARGVFTDQSESAILNYYGITPHVNSVYSNMVEQGRQDFVAANTIIDTMNLINDPRRPYYFTTVDGIYKGGRYGYRNVYDQCSHFAPAMLEADFPAILIDYMEVEFLLAEAAARAYAVSGTPESHYNEAVRQSVLMWGGTLAEANTYLAQPEIGYTSGSTANNFRRKIGLQKWIALYNRGLEAWSEWRRFDTPEFNIARHKTASDIPMRMPYPFNEDNLNIINYQAASAAIGGDEVQTKIFWDIF